jgi:DNA methylase
MKPVALVERAVRNSSKSRDIVLDPFGGSGSALIACEKAGRQARLIELDPKYCDVIIRRWQEFSGRAAVLDGDGQPFEEIAGRETPSGPVISDQRPSWGGSSTSSASPVSP